MKKTLLTVLLALCLLAPAAFAESSPTEASCAGNDYTLTAVLTSSGMRAALTFSFRNTGSGSAALLVRSIALDGECTDTAFRLEAAAGRTAEHRCVWQNKQYTFTGFFLSSFPLIFITAGKKAASL